MKRKVIYILFSILFLQSCQNKEKSQQKSNSIDKVDSGKKTDLSNDSNEQIKLVKNFMKWYIKNMDMLGKFDVIGGGPMDVKENEEAENYYVDFKEAEKYISELKKSGFLTDNILKNEETSFLEADKYYKENPENDGPPYGFDYDHFFLTQEAFEEDLLNIDKIKYAINQKDDFNSEVTFVLPISGKYKYSLKKINEKWFIDKIESVN
ncbi:hypothetical protein [Flavobacterium ginsenosidimutans]|uniref:DUF3828 domain-containing protein n=1 Tax=Flavobacterium ginsenosidimutans TaxID=687844 RepID=A0ABZ2QBV6_9FLAO|nr:hypothetical protein [Flavobacterium ginsenosidimutans]KAF2336013.1 hypothetical protein DM444_04745 [Flavobacterium ginsenosidimutans]